MNYISCLLMQLLEHLDVVFRTGFGSKAHGCDTRHSTISSGLCVAFFLRCRISFLLSRLLQGVPWRKKATELDETVDEKDLPGWCVDCVLHGRSSQRENAKYVQCQKTENSEHDISKRNV